jgi:hypothetical protein
MCFCHWRGKAAIAPESVKVTLISVLLGFRLLQPGQS